MGPLSLDGDPVAKQWKLIQYGSTSVSSRIVSKLTTKDQMEEEDKVRGETKNGERVTFKGMSSEMSR